MSGRAILSRPRTRIYDANYSIGHSYYKPALDRLDRKYSGRPTTPPREPSMAARDVADRHERVFFDEDLATSRRRAEKHISEPHAFDSRGGRIAERALDYFDTDLDEETSATLKRIRASRKKVSVLDDVGLDSAVNSISSHRMVTRAEKLLDSVGINDSSRRALDDEITVKKRSLKVSYEDEADAAGGDLTRWSRLTNDDGTESAAAVRARLSRDRLRDLEDEMSTLAEKTAARERRAARFKQLVAENAEEAEAAESAMQRVSIRARREQREQQAIEY